MPQRIKWRLSFRPRVNWALPHSAKELRLLLNLGQRDLPLTQEVHRRMVCSSIGLNSGNAVQVSKVSP